MLDDPDPPVRRAAAWLFAVADRAGAEQLLTAPVDQLGAPDPVARLALAEALLVRGGDGLAERLRTDADPAVRLRATPAPEGEAVLEDLDAAGTRIGGPGSGVTWRIGTVWGDDPAAAPALPTLRAAAEQSVRVPTYLGDRDEEMHEDERLTAAVRNTLRRIDGLRRKGPGSGGETA
ncbi:hypothetical protein ACFVX6_26025 [Streptomyces sp. NPDC058289]|uniref:hypothetical protein n=1 Tax=Streptomyces sp. NPDC058289 TaxID=3346425 RepID=UPI0036E024A3